MRVGQRLFDLIFKPYTFKQWAKYPAELGPEVLSRIPVRNNHGRYFSDPHQALPKDGSTAFFEKMSSSPKIIVLADTNYFESLSFERVVKDNTPGHFQPAGCQSPPSNRCGWQGGRFHKNCRIQTYFESEIRQDNLLY
ncbi:hypothetical protein ACHAWT_000952 [Skeletonema menzelii]